MEDHPEPLKLSQEARIQKRHFQASTQQDLTLTQADRVMKARKGLDAAGTAAQWYADALTFNMASTLMEQLYAHESQSGNHISIQIECEKESIPPGDPNPLQQSWAELSHKYRVRRNL